MNLLIVDEPKEEFLFPASSAFFSQLARIGEDIIRLGVPNGPRGEALIADKTREAICLRVIRWEDPLPAPPRIDIVLSYPRPSEARRIIRTAAVMAVASLTFVDMELTPSGYAQSKEWSVDKVNTYLREGLSQGFHTHLPKVQCVDSFPEALDIALARGPTTVLDPYIGNRLLADNKKQPDFPGTLIIGSERGFSRPEQSLLKEREYLRFCHMGSCILNNHTAMVAAVSLAHRQTGFWKSAQSASF